MGEPETAEGGVRKVGNYMKMLVVALGNRMRADDGVAFEAVRLAGGQFKSMETMELTPEMAEEISAAECVVFADADYRAGAVLMEELTAQRSCPATMTHALRPFDIVAMARQLFGFRGSAWLLRIPGEDFSAREGLSKTAEANARKAAELLAGMELAGQAAAHNHSSA